MQRAVRRFFVTAGVEPHKETVGPGLAENLGVNIDAEQLVLAPNDQKLWLVRAATEYAAELPKLSPLVLSRLIGSWTWFAMTCRELLSVLNATYKFIKVFPDNLWVEPWESVRQELRALVALAVFIPVQLDRPWSQRVFMTDASWKGQGVIERHAELPEIRQAASLAETRGWVTRIDE